MNAARRKQLVELEARVRQLIDDAESLRDQEQEAYDAMPDSLRESDRGQAASDAVDALDTLVSNLIDAADNAAEARGDA